MICVSSLFENYFRVDFHQHSRVIANLANLEN